MVKRKITFVEENTEDKCNKNIIVFNSIDRITDFIIKEWEGISKNAIKERGIFTAALSGGKTPIPLYQKLSERKSLQWNRTHIFIVDERFVPHEEKESNLRMINNTLLTHVKIPKENVHPIPTKENTPQEAAEKYEKDLLSFFNGDTAPPQFDLILLGIGDDGHTASIFPGNPAVKEKKRWAIPVQPSNKLMRITITFPVINNAKNIIFLVTGGGKAKIAKEVIEKKKNLFPAAMVKPVKGRLFFLLDKGAGALLARS